MAKLYDQIYSLPKPTIAAVQGAAVAGGAGLVSVCDLAVAAQDARFGYPEVRRGLVARPEDWEWSSARWFAGIRPVKIEMDHQVLAELQWD